MLRRISIGLLYPGSFAVGWIFNGDECLESFDIVLGFIALRFWIAEGDEEC